MIVLDLDGTLLDDAGVISQRNIAALHAAQAAQVEVVFATGRRHSFAMQVVRQIGLAPERVLISSNGAVIRTLAAQPIHSRAMTLDLALELCRHLAPWRDSLVLTFDKVDASGEDSRGSLVVENIAALHANIERWVRANEHYIESVSPLESALHSAAAPPIQMMLCGTITAMRAAMVAITSDAFPLGDSVSIHRTEYPERDLGILDIMPKDCSKGVAVAHLASLRGIPLDAVMAIGDNWNDTAMLEVAGHAVVMDNASDELHALARQRGWRRTANNNQHGLAMAVELALGI
jgi:hydroxymethylpyrimidine pyrophosphatase-like HAD family hydrolase